MTAAKKAVLPVYVFLCILLGGSTQAVWGNAALQLLALVIIAWAALGRDAQPTSRVGRQLILMIAALFLLFLAQLVPLPPELWSQLPSRHFIVDGFRLLDAPLPWMPLSLAPYDTLASALTLLPPLAVVTAMLRLRQWSDAYIFWAVLAGAAVSVLLGILQVTSGDGSWYFYRITNLGVAVGTFANGNHFASLLLATIPILAALAGSALRSSENRQQRSMAWAGAFAAAAALGIGALLNSSAAFLLLAPPVAAASVMLAFRISARQRRIGWLAIALFVVIAISSVALFGSKFPGWGTSASIETRTEFWSRSLQAAGDEAATGAGFGTFQKVYQRYEQPASVDRFYVNHAHNDILEIAVEGGMPAIALLLVFVLWWMRQSRIAWTSQTPNLGQKAAAVASAAILAHSIFDYPLRMAAIMCVMAVCVSLLAGAKGLPREGRNVENRPVRHAAL